MAVKFGARASVLESMTVSCDSAAVDARGRAIATPTPREAPDVARSRSLPTLASDPALAARVRRGVDAVRRAIADGSLHHHRPQDVPDGLRSHAAVVLRAWADGHDTDTQRRLCGVCSPVGATRG